MRHEIDERERVQKIKRADRACETCKFSIEMRSPQNPLEWIRVCKWGPPAASVGPGQGGIAVYPLDKVCPPGHWCFMWEPELQ